MDDLTMHNYLGAWSTFVMHLQSESIIISAREV
jgi:hypothetical protein